MSKKIQSFRVGHIYEAYDLYQATYGRNPSYKLAEARAVRHAIQHWKHSTNRPQMDLEVLEVLGGQSNHAAAIRDWHGSPIASYTVLDCVDHSGVLAPGCDRFVKGDALALDPEDVGNYDLVLALFYSVSSVTDPYGSHDVLYEFMRSAYSVLRQNRGAFMLDFALGGLVSSICAAAADEGPDLWDVPVDSPLRRSLGIPEFGEVEITCGVGRTFDRWTCVNTDTFLTPFSVKHEGQEVATFYVERPMTQRYWAESEILSAARAAGFTGALLHSFDYNNSDFTEVPIVLDSDNVASELEAEEASEHYANFVTLLT